jgi:hypothetical protein
VTYCQKIIAAVKQLAQKKLAEASGNRKSKEKMKKTRTRAKAMIRAFANVTIQKLNYQYHNWQTPK